MDLGPVGVWSGQFRTDDEGAARDAVAELDALGYGALWIPGGAGGPIMDVIGRALDASHHIKLATGILNVWMHGANEVAAAHQQLTRRHPGRFLLGLGVSHSMLIDSPDERRYVHPLEVMERYLDALDASPSPVPAGEMALAALGPKMLALSASRTAGAHPYLVSPEHTAFARGVLGQGPLLAPEQKVILETDRAKARDLARANAGLYLRLPNYVNNLLRIGYTADDVAGGGSDRLIDGIVAWGDVETIADRVRQHLDAGADHVCIQVQTADRQSFPLAEWRELASILPTFSSGSGTSA